MDSDVTSSNLQPFIGVLLKCLKISIHFPSENMTVTLVRKTHTNEGINAPQMVNKHFHGISLTYPLFSVTKEW